MEKDGRLRYIRFTNNNDPIPTAPPALSWRTFKHVGLNIRLYDKRIEKRHSSVRAIRYALLNSFFKPPFGALNQHRLPLHEERMIKLNEELKNKTIDDLYNDKAIMGADFVRDEFQDDE